MVLVFRRTASYLMYMSICSGGGFISEKTLVSSDFGKNSSSSIGERTLQISKTNKGSLTDKAPTDYSKRGKGNSLSS